MSTNTQLSIHGTSATAGLTESQWKMVTDTYMKGASAEEVQVFRMVAERAGLDPWKKQIHAVKRWDNKENRYVWTFQTGIDGYTAIAHRSGLCAGIDDAIFDPQDESAPHPKKATVTVYRMVKGQRQPFTASARWSEYAQTAIDKKSGQSYLTGLWKKMPYAQLAKCARALALRQAFPEETSGIYVDAEMDQADNPEQPEQAPARASVATEPEEIPETEPPPSPARKTRPPVQEAEVVSETTPTNAAKPYEPTDEDYDRAEQREKFANDIWREFPVPKEFGITAETLESVRTSKERDLLYAKATGDFRFAVDNMMMTEIAARVANTGITIEEWEEKHGQRILMPTTRLITHIHHLRQKKQ